jgi:periplasmic copper chaperone A
MDMDCESFPHTCDDEKHGVETTGSLRRMIVRRLSVVVAAVLTVLVAVSAPVAAHIDPDPKEGQAGSDLSVGFTVEHGCDGGSATTTLDMRLPDGVANAVPEPPSGWEGSIVDNVVTFTGGPLPDAEQLTFNVRMTLPATPDTTIYFPFVQRCEVGEIRWIDVPTDDSGTELDEPAPAMDLFGPVVVTTPASTPPTTPATPVTEAEPPSTDGAAPSSAEVPATTAATTDTPAEVPDTTVLEAPDGTPVVATAAADEESDGGNGALIIGLIVAAAGLAGVGSLLVARRRR